MGKWREKRGTILRKILLVILQRKNFSYNSSKLFLHEYLGHTHSNFDSVKCVMKMILRAMP
jgi:hypothetical protein